MSITQAPLFAIVLTGILSAAAPAAEEGSALLDSLVKGKPAVPVVLDGDWRTPVELEHAGRQARIVIGDDQSIDYRISLHLQLAETRGSVTIHVFPADSANLRQNARLQIAIGRDPEGKYLNMTAYHWNPETSKWDSVGRQMIVYDPYEKVAAKRAADDKVSGTTWRNRWIPVDIEVTRERLGVWIEGRLQYAETGISAEQPEPRGRVVISTFAGDRARQLEVAAFRPSPQYLPLDMALLGNDQFAKPVRMPKDSKIAVPFELAADGRSYLSLLDAQWVDQKRDPQSYYERYDGGPYFLGDKRMPFLSVPRADYVAMHLLAAAEDDPGRTNQMTVRVGTYGYAQQVVQRDFNGSVPRVGAADGVKEAEKITTPNGPLFHAVIPLDRVVAQDLLTAVMDMELTKPVALARHLPDPNRFRYRPLGVPSGVRIAAITLEKSPLQVRVFSDTPGHAFSEPQVPTFKVELRNITAEEQPYQLDATATHLYGGQSTASSKGVVPAGGVTTATLQVPAVRRGYHDLSVTLSGKDARKLLRRDTSFALLAPDTRQFRDRSPFGAWDWKGGHVTSTDPDYIGPLYVKLGFRYGMSHYDHETRAKYGMLPGFEPKLDPELKTLQKYLETKPQWGKTALIFHENSISGDHVTRVPDLFADRPAYQLNDKEKQRFQQMFEEAVACGKAMRAQDPTVTIKIGNGPLPLKEELLRHKFPAELFDALGNEPGAFHRFPESQPPDYIGNNASIWMDYEILKAYGYGDKTVQQCYEVIYPNDNPGNHDSATLANYFVRHALHSLSWGMPFIHLGQINDVGNSYYFSNWGASGFCRSIPEHNVKPAFVALATLTQVMDGATYVKKHDAGSDALFVVQFQRGDGQQAFAYWTLRGSRPMTWNVEGGPWTLVDDQGIETDGGKGATLTVTAAAAPKYVIGKGTLTKIVPGDPVYDEAPAAPATVVDPLASLVDWTVEPGRDVELETYNFFAPRRKGDYKLEAVKSFAGREGVIKVTPQPVAIGKDAQPMYQVLRHARGIELPGQPTELGVWVHGNCGWGRVIYELQDAGGQRWISIGAAAAGEANRWLLDWLPPEMMKQVGDQQQQDDWNANDAYGKSSINFDGWRYVAFPLPGNYPHENHPRPDNCNWKWSGDGVVKYPLKLTRMVIEMRSKVLHVRDFAPPRRPEIYLSGLTSAGDAR